MVDEGEYNNSIEKGVQRWALFFSIGHVGKVSGAIMWASGWDAMPLKKTGEVIANNE